MPFGSGAFCSAQKQPQNVNEGEQWKRWLAGVRCVPCFGMGEQKASECHELGASPQQDWRSHL